MQRDQKSMDKKASRKLYWTEFGRGSKLSDQIRNLQTVARCYVTHAVFISSRQLQGTLFLQEQAFNCA